MEAVLGRRMRWALEAAIPAGVGRLSQVATETAMEFIRKSVLWRTRGVLPTRDVGETGNE